MTIFLKVSPQPLRNRENHVSVSNPLQDFIQQELTKKALSFLSAGWTKPSGLATERKQQLMATIRTAAPRKPEVHQATLQKLIDHHLMTFPQGTILWFE
jgi:hypothetical protein